MWFQNIYDFYSYMYNNMSKLICCVAKWNFVWKHLQFIFLISDAMNAQQNEINLESSHYEIYF